MRGNSEFEKTIKNANNLNAVCEAIKQLYKMKSAPSTSSAASDQHNKLKGEHFFLFEGASDDEMQAFWEVAHLVDDSLDQSDTRKSTLEKKPKLQTFSLITAVKSI